MKIRALAPWFGGKRTLAADIVAELGPHTQFFDPFCGGMSIILAKPPSQKETVNDLHGDLINLSRVVATEWAAERLYERLAVAPFSEGLLEDARAVIEEPSDDVVAMFEGAGPYERGGYSIHGAHIERAYWYFLASWMGRNGTAGTERLDYQIAVRWTKNGGSPVMRFRNAVESIPAWHRRLLNVVILRRDAFDIIDRFEDCKETAIYADPPYPAETRSNLNEDGNATSGGGGGRYLHEFSHGRGGLFESGDDHDRLAAALRTYKRARVVVSTYDCERYRRLYAGWTFIDKTRQKHLHVMGGRGSRPMEAPEVLIVNGPSWAEGAA